MSDPVKSSGRRPPALRLQFVRNMGVLFIINIIPVLGSLYFAHQVISGKMVIRDMNALVSLVMIFLLSFLCIACFFIMLPTARWAFNYTLWSSYNRSMLLWVIPTMVSALFLFAAAVISLIAAGTTLFLLFNALAKVFGG